MYFVYFCHSRYEEKNTNQHDLQKCEVQKKNIKMETKLSVDLNKSIEKLPVPEKSKIINLNSDMDASYGSNTYDPSMESYHPLEHAFWKTEKTYVSFNLPYCIF